MYPVATMDTVHVNPGATQVVLMKHSAMKINVEDFLECIATLLHLVWLISLIIMKANYFALQ